MKNRQAGFTLIELMISITILSALLFTGSYTYQILAERWQGELGEFDNTVTLNKNIAFIKTVLQGIQPFVVIDKVQSNKPAIFFIGAKTSLLSVSSSGLINTQYPEIFRISSVERETGLYDLVYQSTSSKNTLLLTTTQEIVFDNEVELLKDLTDVKFQYFGWDGIRQRSEADESNDAVLATWRDSYSGIDNQLMPERMVLTILKGNEQMVLHFYYNRNVLKYLSPYLEQE